MLSGCKVVEDIVLEHSSLASDGLVTTAATIDYVSFKALNLCLFYIHCQFCLYMMH